MLGSIDRFLPPESFARGFLYFVDDAVFTSFLSSSCSASCGCRFAGRAADCRPVGSHGSRGALRHQQFVGCSADCPGVVPRHLFVLMRHQVSPSSWAEFVAGVLLDVPDYIRSFGLVRRYRLCRSPGARRADVLWLLDVVRRPPGLRDRAPGTDRNAGGRCLQQLPRASAAARAASLSERDEAFRADHPNRDAIVIDAVSASRTASVTRATVFVTLRRC